MLAGLLFDGASKTQFKWHVESNGDADGAEVMDRDSARSEQFEYPPKPPLATLGNLKGQSRNAANGDKRGRQGYQSPLVGMAIGNVEEYLRGIRPAPRPFTGHGRALFPDP